MCHMSWEGLYMNHIARKGLALLYGVVFVGLERAAFDNKTVSFEGHCKQEHNMWHYLYFIVLIRVKDPTEFTGPESYVHSMIKVCHVVIYVYEYIG